MYSGEPEVDEYFLVEADLSTFGGETQGLSSLLVILVKILCKLLSPFVNFFDDQFGRKDD
jgi:hypothetical protein